MRRMFTLAALFGAVLFCAPGWSAGSVSAGVDLSHWDGSVNWRALVAGRRSFVFAEATRGRTTVDPTYAVNHAGAKTVGLPFGAFHFALPQGTTPATMTVDAIAQADAFVNEAQPAAGDLLPALDLERSDNLSPANLIAWAGAWLEEAQARLGVKPIIYASLNFWRDAMADTTQFAVGGYKLWYARYTRASDPPVPAANWAGNGWTFWQWTSCARIRGLARCGDADRFRGKSLRAVRIPNVPTLPPGATTQPTIVGTPQSGHLLAAVPGLWVGAEPISFAYQWDRCDGASGWCTAIAGANQEAYRAQPQDVADVLTVQVTASNAKGTATATVSTPAVSG